MVLSLSQCCDLHHSLSVHQATIKRHESPYTQVLSSNTWFISPPVSKLDVNSSRDDCVDFEELMLLLDYAALTKLYNVDLINRYEEILPILW